MIEIQLSWIMTHNKASLELVLTFYYFKELLSVFDVAICFTFNFLARTTSFLVVAFKMSKLHWRSILTSNPYHIKEFNGRTNICGQIWRYIRITILLLLSFCWLLAFVTWQRGRCSRRRASTRRPIHRCRNRWNWRVRSRTRSVTTLTACPRVRQCTSRGATRPWSGSMKVKRRCAFPLIPIRMNQTFCDNNFFVVSFQLGTSFYERWFSFVTPMLTLRLDYLVSIAYQWIVIKVNPVFLYPLLHIIM